MIIDNFINQEKLHAVSGLFSVCGSFGRIGYQANYERTTEDNSTIFTHENTAVRLRSVWTEQEFGVMHRKDVLINITDKPIEIYALSSRFALAGNEYDVYTQYSGWQHESEGAWSHLTTQITVGTGGIRACDGATPILALHDLYTEKNIVFHLLANCQWKMTARKYPLDKREMVVVETGMNENGLRLVVQPGETIVLPEIYFFIADSKRDLDAYKMHAVFNRLYPRRQMPVIYNSWLHAFEWPDVDELKKQADTASELGVDYFVVDAGWFGTQQNWSLSVGDWVENPNRGTKGRLKELSDHVHAKGMRMGLWFEPERAGLESDAYKKYPEFFMVDEGRTALLDFTNPQAREYILRTVSEQIEKYSLDYVKFDGNCSIPHDPMNSAFYRYHQGQALFIQALKEKFPDLYITNCAGGGFRMEMGQATITDSFWFTDNQGPYEGLTIIKDTLKRLPSSCIERWIVQKYLEGFPAYHPNHEVGLMVSCNNATWDHIVAVSDAYNHAFATGGPIGFSCDLARMPESYKQSWKTFIKEHKAKSEFYKNATARVLIDNPHVIALEYADTCLNRCEVLLFTKLVYTKDILVYPSVDTNANYRVGDAVLSGKEIAQNGLYIRELKDNNAVTIELIKEN